MLRLLNIELQKMRYNRATKVLLSIYALLFFSVVLFTSIQFKIGDLDFSPADQGIFNFPYIWHFNAYFAAILKIFPALVIISMMTMEYNNRTLKQNLIDGLSKKEFVLSKFYALVALSLASTLLLFLVSLVLGLVFSDQTSIQAIFSEMQYLAGYFLKLITFFSFCFFIATLVKRSAFSVGALFIWWILEGVIRLIIKARGRQQNTEEWLTSVLPLQSMSNLLKEPFTKMGALRETVGQGDSNLHWQYIVIAITWTFIFIFSSYKLLKSKDL